MAMNNTAQQVLELARGELGTTSGDKYIEFYNRLTGAGLPYGVAWCAAWVTWVMRKAGVPEESVLNYKGCSTGSEWFAARGRFYGRGSGYIPKPGDIIMYEWNPENENGPYDDGDDHTGIVERVENGKVHTLEGNNGGKCQRDWWSVWAEEISGYCVPLYNFKEESEEENMLTYEQFKDFMERYEKERDQKPEGDWSRKEGHWKNACEEKVFDGKSPRAPLTREQAASVLGRLGLLKTE